MEWQQLDLNVQDLPKHITIDLPDSQTMPSLHDIKETMKAQIIYNSRFILNSEGGQDDFRISIEVVEEQSKTLKMKISREN